MGILALVLISLSLSFFFIAMMGCLQVERVQVGPDHWPFESMSTTRPSYANPTSQPDPMEVDTQTAQEIIDELFGDLEANR